MQNCPFCAKVRDYLQENNISVPMKDIRENPDYREELIKIGNKAQVPCLIIDGKALYESDEILRWIEKNLKTQK